MKKLVTRAYNNFKIDHSCGIIRKVSSTERIRDEAIYYHIINRDHPRTAIFFPRILESWIHGEDEYWMDIELYDYSNIGTYLCGDNIMPSWEEFFTTLREILQTFSDVAPRPQWSEEMVVSSARDMYINKTEREQQNFYDGWKDKLPMLFGDGNIILNGKEYKLFDSIWPDIKSYIENNMLTFTPSIIHGDCCFSNILYGEKSNIIRFIDPRGSFGQKGIYGDIRYDVAKLYHSVDGMYEAYITDRFKVEQDGNTYTLIVRDCDESSVAKEEFEKAFFPQFNKKEIKIIQGCIFIGMCARHYDSIERQRAMYLTGIRLLNEALEL